MVDAIAEAEGIALSSVSFKALIGKGSIFTIKVKLSCFTFLCTFQHHVELPISVAFDLFLVSVHVVTQSVMLYQSSFSIES